MGISLFVIIFMKILITGAGGTLGQTLKKAFADHEVTAWERADLDITDEKQVEKKILALRPQVIINAAAYNAVDESEDRFDLALKINHHGPVNLAKAAAGVGAVLIHYSTDYVFNGEKKDGYVEHDLPAPISRYGESKYLGEEAREHNPETYIVRTSRLFGLPGHSEGGKKSFVQKMLELSEKKQELQVVDEEVSCPTYVNDLAVQTRLLLEGNYHPGIYHVANEPGCTWYEFAREIFRLAGRRVSISPVSGDKFKRPADRPRHSILKNTKMPEMRTWKEALEDFLFELGELNYDKDQQKDLEIFDETKKEEMEKKEIQNEILKQKKETKEEDQSRTGTKEGEKIDIKVERKEEFKEKKETKKMKGIILSGGKGTRLYPLTKITSKQLLPVYNKPMIMYPLETLIQAGIKEILVIVAPEYAGQYLQLLGSGSEWGVKITYEIQEKPKGLPEAFVIGENFIGQDNVTMILGDNLFFDHDFTNDIKSFEKGGRIFAVEVPDPERFGVVEFDEHQKVLSIEEKPKKPKSNYAVPGIYIFDNRVVDIAKKIKPTWREETDITEAHKAFLDMDELDVRLVQGRWLDAGTHKSLLQAGNIAASDAFLKKMGYNKEAMK